jgi:hypothetical protein
MKIFEIYLSRKNLVKFHQFTELPPREITITSILVYYIN